MRIRYAILALVLTGGIHVGPCLADPLSATQCLDPANSGKKACKAVVTAGRVAAPGNPQITLSYCDEDDHMRLQACIDLVNGAMSYPGGPVETQVGRLKEELRTKQLNEQSLMGTSAGQL